MLGRRVSLRNQTSGARDCLVKDAVCCSHELTHARQMIKYGQNWFAAFAAKRTITAAWPRPNPGYRSVRPLNAVSMVNNQADLIRRGGRFDLLLFLNWSRGVEDVFDEAQEC